MRPSCRLVLKLQRMRHDIDIRARDPIRGAAMRPQLDTLDELIAEARQVESAATSTTNVRGGTT